MASFIEYNLVAFSFFKDTPLRVSRFNFVSELLSRKSTRLKFAEKRSQMDNDPKQPDFLDWLAISRSPDWSKARPLGSIVGALLTIVVPLLFLSAILAASAVIWNTIIATTLDSAGPNLGAGALIAALLGAPFVIWTTVLKYQALRYQKEGHITDRINKAVEQLGADKPVERIGRAVTIWTGKPFEKFVDDAELEQGHYTNLPKTVVSENFKDEKRQDPATGYFKDYYFHKVSQWFHAKSVIQWQGEKLDIRDYEHVADHGEWQVFKETAKNIEVRVGAILSLERIAQDSTLLDNGRDHTRVMEILCAYIRENNPCASLAIEDDQDGPFQVANDIQIALDVIKRRTPEQVKIEEKTQYRLDLRGCDFRGVHFEYGQFRGAIFARCRFENANFTRADFTGAHFEYSVLNYMNCHKANFTGANFDYCRLDKPVPIVGGFITSINMGNLTGASFIAANIPSLQYIHDHPTFGTKDTVLNWELDEERQAARQSKSGTDVLPEHWQKDEKGNVLPFGAWSPFDSTDLVTGHLLSSFRKALGLTSWPHIGK